MRKALALLTIILSPVLVVAQSQSFAITHVTVLGTDGTPAKTDMTVVVTGNRIAAVGKTGKIRAPRGSHVVDASGKFMIPGLSGMHVQGLRLGRPDFCIPLFVANGITSVRDMGGSFPPDVVRRMRADIAAGRLVGPRLLAAPGKIIDGPFPTPRDAFMSVNSPEEARGAVEASKAAGWDFVKAYNLLSRDAYLALIDESKRRGIPVAGHVPFSMTAAEVSDLGQASVEHAADLLVSASRAEESLRKLTLAEGTAATNSNWARARIEIDAARTYDEAKTNLLFAKFARNGTWQCPTLVLKRMSAAPDREALAHDPRLKYIPRLLQQRWSNTFDQLVVPIGTPEDRALRAAATLRLVGAMQRAGVKILAGTDTPPQPYLYPGFSLHEELALMVEAGLTPLQALQTATLNPAIFLKMRNSLGTVERGNLADLVLLDANPLEDINNTKKINAVVLNGRLLDRRALDKLLADAEAAANKK